ncbi:LysR family transcriptional regulator [Erwinia mallotivora]|uniref:LysR family transcriptional regulator n=1 Tax=Erwinia mallotivora TaxID=69222 RepID=A0A014MH07_9GAMM|nr:LysR family transcriptional regulator [Erwinia mallotivora]EXU77399.1 LysR family transcriptional regulator [Erwinia mallotivora]
MNKIDISRLDLNLLKVFEALYEEGGAGRAAVRLGLTQSAVSAALGRLRLVWHDRLFERTGRGLRPTARASELKQPISDILNQCRLTLSAFSAETSGWQGRTVILALSDDFELAWGSAIIAAVRQQMPGLRIQFRQTYAQLVEEMLILRQADLAITSGGIKSPLLSRQLSGTGRYRCLLAGKPDGPFELAEFLARPHILVSSGGFIGIVDEKLAELALTRHVIASTTHFAALPWMIGETDAIATLPAHAAEALAEKTALTVVDCPLALPTFSVELAMRLDNQRDPAVNGVRNLLTALLT